MKQTIRPTKSELKHHSNKWRYEGTEVDKYMWVLKKDAEKKGQVREDGWPTIEYIEEFHDYADSLLNAGFDDCYINGNNDYSLKDLWQYVDHFLYRRALDFGPDVLGRPIQKECKSWFYRSIK